MRASDGECMKVTGSPQAFTAKLSRIPRDEYGPVSTSTDLLQRYWNAVFSGVDFRFAQIGGDAKNVTALQGGHIDVTSLSIGSFTKLGEDFRALAIYSAERRDGVDIPTFKEQGYDITYTVQNWWFAPKDTPQQAIDHFAAALKAAGETKYAMEAFAGRNSKTVFSSGQEFADLVAAAYTQVKPLAQIAAQKTQ